MTNMLRRIVPKFSMSVSIAAAVLVVGCAGQPARNIPLPAGAPPPACNAAALANAPMVKLKQTRAPTDDEGAFAQRIDIDRSLTRAGRWTDVSGGWSVLSLGLQSQNARSLSAQLSQLDLPDRTQIYWCSPDGRERNGPYRDAAGGSLWTPVVSGERAHLEIWVPSALRDTFKGTLANVQGGYR